MARVYRRPRLEKFGGGHYPDWFIEFRSADGRKVREKAGPNKRHAEVLLAQRVADVEEQRRNPLPAQGDGSQLFADFIVDYHATALARLVEREARMKRLKCWAEFFGPRARLRDITREMVEARIARRLDAGLAPATVNRDLAAIKAALQRAVEWRRIPYNAAMPVKLLREDNERDLALSADESAKLVAAARESRNVVLSALIILALNTGGRRGELLGLKWSDIDRDRGLVRFTKTKAKRNRSVPVEDWVLRELDALPKGGERVFTFRDAPMRTVRTAFASARARAGFGPDVVFHTLRHTFASRLAERGAPASDIQRLLGHSSLAMVQRYVHSADERLRAAVAGLNLGRPDLHVAGERTQIGLNSDQGAS